MLARVCSCTHVHTAHLYIPFGCNIARRTSCPKFGFPLYPTAYQAHVQQGTLQHQCRQAPLDRMYLPCNRHVIPHVDLSMHRPHYYAACRMHVAMPLDHCRLHSHPPRQPPSPPRSRCLNPVVPPTHMIHPAAWPLHLLSVGNVPQLS